MSESPNYLPHVPLGKGRNRAATDGKTPRNFSKYASWRTDCQMPKPPDSGGEHQTRNTVHDQTGLHRRHNRVASETGPRSAGSWAVCCAILAAGIAGCTPFDVKVATDAPLKVDLNMEVHVYQHGEPDEAEKATRQDYKAAMTNRRDRMKEIQDLKNNRIVGENREGLLALRTEPAGDYGAYVKKTVDAENADRNYLIEHEAKEKSSDVAEVRRIQWRHWQRKSFPGEWIEVEDGGEGKFKWVQKQGASEDSGEEVKPEAPKSEPKAKRE